MLWSFWSIAPGAPLDRALPAYERSAQLNYVILANSKCYMSISLWTVTNYHLLPPYIRFLSHLR